MDATPHADSVTVPTAAGQMPALRWAPEAGAGPGVVLVQEIFGLSTYIRRRAAELATAGFVVLAPELYWRVGESAIEEAGADALQRAMDLMGRLDFDEAVADTRSALTALREDPALDGGAGLLGFCLGGGIAFAAAAQDAPGALVSYYGSALPQLTDLAGSVHCPSLHHFGDADDYIPMDQVERIREALTAGPGLVRFEVYPGAGHAFDNPAPAFHHPQASAQAWPRTLAFLSENLSAR